MTTTKKTINDPDLARIEAALIRAGQRARETARTTKTPLVFYKDGKVVLEYVEDDADQESAQKPV